jgi:peptidoglycan hydrolase-like amidase
MVGKPDGPVRVGVLSLFHPTELWLRGVAGAGLALDVDGHRCVLDADAVAVIRREDEGRISVGGGDGPDSERLQGTSLRVQERAGGVLRFWLEVPGKLKRQYAGALEVRAKGAALEPVVIMPLEVAVASIVQAESPPGAWMEALKAQAVASRSFLVARRSGHVDFDFCDTTHCQFLRSPPAVGSLAAKAAQETAGLVLLFHPATGDRTDLGETPVAAMYSRSCGGRTRTLREIGSHGGSDYPYYSVRCAYCLRHPERWRTTGVRGPLSERDRLGWNRTHGWGAIPSLGSEKDATGTDVEILSGRGVGHGVGLCQLGAADMARHGVGFAEILAHYYPNTRLASVQGH